MSERRCRYRKQICWRKFHLIRRCTWVEHPGFQNYCSNFCIANF
jgi:hypothetical protein